MRKFVLKAECSMIVTVNEGEDIDEQIDREVSMLALPEGWECMDVTADEIEGAFA